MAEVHFVGQILGGTGFPGKGMLCKWGMEASEDTWDVLEGFDQGQTHTSWPQDCGKVVWAHPIDIHYQCLGLSGWPKLRVQVWSVDYDGRIDICGYGAINFPTTPVERFSAFFVGGQPRLVDETVVFSGNDRFRLSTTASGTVHIRIGCMLRGFLQNGVSVC